MLSVHHRKDHKIYYFHSIFNSILVKCNTKFCWINLFENHFKTSFSLHTNHWTSDQWRKIFISTRMTHLTITEWYNANKIRIIYSRVVQWFWIFKLKLAVVSARVTDYRMQFAIDIAKRGEHTGNNWMNVPNKKYLLTQEFFRFIGISLWVLKLNSCV